MRADSFQFPVPVYGIAAMPISRSGFLLAVYLWKSRHRTIKATTNLPPAAHCCGVSFLAAARLPPVNIDTVPPPPDHLSLNGPRQCYRFFFTKQKWHGFPGAKWPHITLTCLNDQEMTRLKFWNGKICLRCYHGTHRASSIFRVIFSIQLIEARRRIVSV